MDNSVRVYDSISTKTQNDPPDRVINFLSGMSINDMDYDAVNDRLYVVNDNIIAVVDKASTVDGTIAASGIPVTTNGRFAAAAIAP